MLCQDNGAMARANSQFEPVTVQPSNRLNQYLPHAWYSFATCRWFYAIKKQPHVGAWAFIQVGDDVRTFQSEAARDAEIVRLEHLELEVARKSAGKAKGSGRLPGAGMRSDRPALGCFGGAGDH